MLIWNGTEYRMITVGHPAPAPAPVVEPANVAHDRAWEQARQDHIRRYEQSMELSHRFGRLLDQPKFSALRRM